MQHAEPGGGARGRRQLQRTPAKVWGFTWLSIVAHETGLEIPEDEEDDSDEEFADVEFRQQVVTHAHLRGFLLTPEGRRAVEHLVEMPPTRPDGPPITWQRQLMPVRNESKQGREWTKGSIPLFKALVEDCRDRVRVVNDFITDNSGPHLPGQ